MTTAISTAPAQHQRTLRSPLSFFGVGLHTGRRVTMTIHPQDPGTGIRFLRNDVASDRASIRALWCNVCDTQLSTTLHNTAGTRVATVEHLLAALHGCGIDNAMIELDGPEVPAMDGSAQPFVTAIEQSGTVLQPVLRRFIQVLQPVCVIRADKVALLVPYHGRRFSLDIHFPHPAVGFQHLSMTLDSHDFRDRIAPARSFGFLDDLERLRDSGLIKGGSLHNAVVFDQNGVMNRDGLRFSNECVRHKLLDCVGDLALAGAPILGQFYGYKSGHTLNNLLLHRLFGQTGVWRYTSDWPEAQETPAMPVSETDNTPTGGVFRLRLVPPPANPVPAIPTAVDSAPSASRC